MLRIARPPMTIKTRTETRVYEVECSDCGRVLSRYENRDGKIAFDKATTDQRGHARLHTGHRVNIYRETTTTELVDTFVDASDAVDFNPYAQPSWCQKCGGFYDEQSYCDCPITGKGA